MSSGEINKTKLIPASDVTAANPKLKAVSMAETLALKLASKTFFGPEVMKQWRSQLLQMKAVIFAGGPHIDLSLSGQSGQ